MAHLSRMQMTRLSAAIAASFPLAGYVPWVHAQSAARIDFASSGVTATGSDGRPRSLKKGDEVQPGETISTGDGSHAYLRFIDGQQMALKPQSQMKIDAYAYSPDKPEGDRAILNFIRGGFRTITGLIGKRRREDYQIRTSTATVGIRGTELAGEVGDGFQLTCGQGGCDVTNNQTGQTESLSGGETYTCQSAAGCTVDEKISLQNGTQTQNKFFGNTKPITGGGGYAPIEDDGGLQPFWFGNVAGQNGGLQDLIPSNGPLSIVAVNTIVGLPTLYTGTYTTTFNGGVLTGFSGVNTQNGNTYNITGTGTTGITDGALTIGTWSVVTGTLNGLPYNATNLHYVVGTPTLLSSMPTSGGVFYSLSSATIPTSTSGYMMTLNSASVSVNFAASSASLSMNLHYSGPEISGSLIINSAPVAGAVSGNALTMNALSVVNQFNCAAGSANIRGSFAGGGASQLGFVYSITGSPAGTVKGAVSTKGTPII